MGVKGSGLIVVVCYMGVKGSGLIVVVCYMGVKGSEQIVVVCYVGIKGSGLIVVGKYSLYSQVSVNQLWIDYKYDQMSLHTHSHSGMCQSNTIADVQNYNLNITRTVILVGVYKLRYSACCSCSFR